MPNESFINAAIANIDLFDTLYHSYLRDKNSVDASWQKIFEKLNYEEFKEKIPAAVQLVGKADLRIYRLIDAYRTYGHLAAKVNPIATESLEIPVQLNLKELGFQDQELSKVFPTCGLLKEPEAPLLEIINALKEIYSGRIGIEYMGMQSPELEAWMQQKIEPNRLAIDLSLEQRQEIFQQLNKSELFESFLHTKYAGQKRFSLEGGETLIPMLAALIDKGADLGFHEFYIGMAHRGRLNVLSNILNKSYKEIFSEFDEGYFPDSFEGTGDVKYHKGFLSDVKTIHGHNVLISLVPNPSHLESVNPVVEGEVFARQVKLKDYNKEKAIALLVHGDAAVAGQGIIYETLQLYNLPNYSTGGTIHIVVNNQIGFTTLPKDGRSTFYCTDIAKAFGAPVFHVNAEDPEACVYATLLAMEIRGQFHCDVFIDLNCYRKYGHNEGDEPAFTQPIEYTLIRSKKTIREIYRDRLESEGQVEKFMAETLENEFKKALNQALKAAKPASKIPEVGDKSPPGNLFTAIDTGVSYKVLRHVAEQICLVPQKFAIHSKLENLLKERLNMVIPEANPKPMDWGMAELLAYGTLLYEGTPLRLSGQDTGRGTFSHRHALWVDQKTTASYFPLSNIIHPQARVDVINSPLSEFASLGFEYGYSVAYPETLVIWEAQFGDFANGAQIVIDQYISSAEQKWGQKSGLVLLLPHGYEGQGPEHSSARLERFLSLAGNYNMIIANPTTPAQLFHLLRRQAIGNLLKPLIVMTPKGLLRHPECVSKVQDLEPHHHFEEILDDPEEIKNAKRLLICSGRIYYDLKAEREKKKQGDIVLIRVEQLYPLNKEKLKGIFKKYASASEVLWVQEEPQNMGPWSYIHSFIVENDLKQRPIKYVGRARSASPATGSYAFHKKEYSAIMNEIFDKKPPSALDIPHHFRV